MDMRLTFGHHLDTFGRKAVLDPADRNFIARNLL